MGSQIPRTRPGAYLALLLALLAGQAAQAEGLNLRPETGGKDWTREDTAVARADPAATVSIMQAPNGCLTNHNADVDVTYAIGAGTGKTLQWYCASTPTSGRTGLMAFYTFETRSGCYVKQSMVLRECSKAPARAVAPVVTGGTVRANFDITLQVKYLSRLQAFEYCKSLGLWPETHSMPAALRVGCSLYYPEKKLCVIVTPPPVALDDDATRNVGHELDHCLRGETHD
jgi:hypothetical protein